MFADKVKWSSVAFCLAPPILCPLHHQVRNVHQRWAPPTNAVLLGWLYLGPQSTRQDTNSHCPQSLSAQKWFDAIMICRMSAAIFKLSGMHFPWWASCLKPYWNNYCSIFRQNAGLPLCDDRRTPASSSLVQSEAVVYLENGLN